MHIGVSCMSSSDSICFHFLECLFYFTFTNHVLLRFLTILFYASGDQSKKCTETKIWSVVGAFTFYNRFTDGAQNIPIALVRAPSRISSRTVTEFLLKFDFLFGLYIWDSVILCFCNICAVCFCTFLLI